MGRPERPIPEHLPMKAMADYLRHLRRKAGSPTYRVLARLVHIEQQSLSQTANGNRVGWGRVLLYVQALRMHDPDCVTPEELAALKNLHTLGEQQHRTVTTRSLRSRQSRALWDEVDNATAWSAATTSRRTAGQWTLTPGITDTAQLNAAHTLTDLFLLLNETAERRGLDLFDPRRSKPTAAKAFSWFGSDVPAPIPTVPQVRDPHELTLDTMAEIIRICGGTDGDRTAWLAAWDRVHRNTRQNGPSPGDMPRQAAGMPRSLRPPAPPQRDHRMPRWAGNVMRRPAALGLLPT